MSILHFWGPGVFERFKKESGLSRYNEETREEMWHFLMMISYPEVRRKVLIYLSLLVLWGSISGRETNFLALVLIIGCQAQTSFIFLSFFLDIVFVNIDYNESLYPLH